MGNYKQAHQLLFRTYQDLKSQKLALPQELWRRLMLLHSYVSWMCCELSDVSLVSVRNPKAKVDLFFSGLELIQTVLSTYMVPCPVLPPPPPPPWYGSPPPPPIPHAFCTRHCSETYISILLHARRCSETHIFILLDEPSRRIRWVDRAKLWRNANFKLQEWLRAVYRTLQCSANGIIYIYISMYIHIHNINSYICKNIYVY